MAITSEPHPHLVGDLERVPAGIAQELARTHCWVVLHVDLVSGELCGVWGGNRSETGEIRALSESQAEGSVRTNREFYALHRRRYPGKRMACLKLRVVSGLIWLDTEDAFGLHVPARWINEQWGEITYRFQTAIGWDGLKAPGEYPL